MVNGRKYAWEDISIMLANQPGIGIQDISWDEEKELEGIYGIGSKPIGYSQGNWKAEGKVTILVEDYQILLAYARGLRGGIFDFKPFNIIVNYANDEEVPHTTLLMQCKFAKKSRKASQGEKKNTVDLDFQIFGDIREQAITGEMVSASSIL